MCKPVLNTSGKLEISIGPKPMIVAGFVIQVTGSLEIVEEAEDLSLGKVDFKWRPLNFFGLTDWHRLA